MTRGLIRTILLAGACAAAAPGLAHAAWTKTYALEWAEPAMLYGAKSGLIEPGTDCPDGNKEPNWEKILVQEGGYTPEEAAWLRNPANPTRSAVHGQNQMAFRGKDRANVYINPTSTPESGDLKPMVGKVAEGLNLDGDLKTGFVSPTGEKGIDNNFYKAVGCWKTYRGPARLATGQLSHNDGMRDGSFTVVIVVSGKGNDPMNDKDVTVGFYDSPDKLVKDGMGNVSRDYTFRIKPSLAHEAIFKAKTVNGKIISTQAMDQVTLREPSYTRNLELLKAQISLEMKPDGNLKGYMAGYRPWQPVYKAWVDARGPVIESLTWVRLPDVYYALQKNADYSPAGPKGEKTHISFALRVEAVPAYVISPDATSDVLAVASYKSIAKPEPVVTGGLATDGIVVGRGAKAVSQTAEQIRPPRPVASATPAANGG